jgi:acetylornithine deacetylase/succinyl-diaminopimelate desuccinylase-like protein
MTKQLELKIDRTELVELAGAMIRIPSVSGDEEQLAQFLLQWFHEREIAAELQYAAPGRPNVIATLPGTGGGKSLMLNGHIDMTAVLPNYVGDPWEPKIEGNDLCGAGISNMKGQVASMCAALAALKRGEPLAGDVILTAVVGECDLLGLGTKALLDSGIRTDAAICSEPTQLRLTLAHAGLYQWRMTVAGSSAHQQEREKGDNAILHAMNLIPFLDETKLTYTEHQILDRPPLMVGQIEGGVLPSVTAPSCVVSCDIRTVPGMTKEQITADIEAMIERAKEKDPGLSVEIENFVYSPPFEATDDTPFYEVLGDAHKDVRGAPMEFDRGRWLGVTDCSHLATTAGIPTALYGPGSFTMVDDHDHLEIDQMNDAAEIFALTASRFCG